MKDISKRIKELREEHNMSQTELAEKLFVTHQTVSNWETRKTRPDIETLEVMSKIFGIDMIEFLYGTEEDAAERKRKLVQICIFSGCIIFALFINIYIYPRFQDLFITRQVVFPYYITGLILQILYGCAAPLVLSILSLNTDIRIKSANVRKTLFVVAIFLIAVYMIYSFVSILATIENFSIPHSIIVIWHIINPYYFIAVNALLYLGIKKRK